MAYYEIQDINLINELGSRLNDVLNAANTSSEIRRIGYPKGSTVREVGFIDVGNAMPLWHCSFETEEKRRVNLFGHANPNENTQINIDVQFNYRMDEFSKGMGAAFLQDTDSNEVLLAHRGIVTKGQRVKKNAIFDVMADDIITAETRQGDEDYLLISPIESKDLLKNISSFGRRLREKINAMGADVKGGSSDQFRDKGTVRENADKKPAKFPRGAGFPALRKYFDEFSGQRRAFRPKRVYANSMHGEIVRALERKFSEHGAETLKSGAVDLVVNSERAQVLFEIKTSAGTQNIYAAVGQLFIHKDVVARAINCEIDCALVIPEYPPQRFVQVLEETLGIRIITYKLANQAVEFFGLEKFL